MDRITHARLADRMSAYLKAHEAHRRFSGTVLVAADNELVLHAGYGMADVEGGRPCGELTRYCIGSITKCFQSLAVFRLRDEGLLGIEDPIAKHLDDCPPHWGRVTVHQLLTHTSGITRSVEDVLAYFAYKDRDTAAADRIVNAPLEFEPGTSCAFNNAGFQLLDVIIEAVSGKPADDYLADALLGPLDLVDTLSVYAGAGDPEMAHGYGIVTDHVVDRGDPRKGGGLVSTVIDLWHLDRALAEGGVVSPESQRIMWTPGRERYACGWVVSDVWGREFVGHDGGIQGFASSFWRSREPGTCIAVLSNYDSAPTQLMAHDLAAMVFGYHVETPAPFVRVALDQRVLDSVVGHYEMPSGYARRIGVRRIGARLFGSVGEGADAISFELIPQATDVFVTNVTAAPWQAVHGHGGAVTGFAMRVSGQDIVARRVG